MVFEDHSYCIEELHQKDVQTPLITASEALPESYRIQSGAQD